MHVDMVIQFLVPGMERLDNAGCGAKIFRIGRKRQECFCAAFMEKAVEKGLVAVQKRIQFMRQGKNHMKIGCINDFRAAAVYPEFLLYRLAVRAMAVPAGIVVGFRMSAFGTDADVAATFFRLASDDSLCGFPLDVRQMQESITEGAIGIAENILYFKIRHGRHPLTGQRGL